MAEAGELCQNLLMRTSPVWSRGSVLVVAIALGSLAGCDLQDPHVLLTIQDPYHLAVDATAVSIRSGDGAPRTAATHGKSFPMTATLYSPSAGTRFTVWAEALAADDQALARGRVEVVTPKHGTGAAEVELAWACERTGATGNPCAVADGSGAGLCVAGACVLSRWGDGFTDASTGETCDAGDGNSDTLADACRTTCRLASCGDTVADTGEECDDGNDIEEDACVGTCALNRCADGWHNPLAEGCDDGNTVNEDACLATCQPNTCGDGFRNPAAEECDDGNEVETDACHEDCTNAHCGDGDLWATQEVCDDGNTTSGDGCRGDCLWIESCDNGTVDPDEDCDDQNTDPNDGCNACRATSWAASVLLGQITTPPTAATVGLNGPEHVVFDAVPGVADYLYIADTNNHRVLRVTLATQAVEFYAGRGNPGFAGDGGPAASATLSYPRGLAVDGFHNLYIVDSANHRIRRVLNASRVIETVAGGVAGYQDGTNALAARFSSPQGLAIDGNTLYLADNGNRRVRRLAMTDVYASSSWVVSTLVGTGSGCSGVPPACGDGGPAAAATLTNAIGVAVGDRAGIPTLFVSDFSAYRVRAVDLRPAQLTITTVAGNGTYSATSPDGVLATTVSVRQPRGLAVDSSGTLYIGEELNRVRAVGAVDGFIATAAGNGTRGYVDGPAADAQLSAAYGISATTAALFLADTYNHRVRRLESGEVSTAAGSGVRAEGSEPADDKLATTSGLSMLAGVVVDRLGNLYASDSYWHQVWRVEHATTLDRVQWRLTRVAGTGTAGYLAGAQPARQSPLTYPTDLAIDGTDRLYIVDSGSFRVRRVTFTDLNDPTSGVMETVAGNGSGPTGVFFEERPAIGEGMGPVAVAVDTNGDLLVSDGWMPTIWRVRDDQIRAVSGDGTWCPLDGTYTFYECPDSTTGATAQWACPGDLAVDASTRTLYATDWCANLVRTVALDDGEAYATQRVAGTGTYCDPWSTGGLCFADGEVALLAPINPWGLAVDAAGAVVLGDYWACVVMEIQSGAIRRIMGDYSYCGRRGDGGPAGAARVSWNLPTFAVSVDGATLFVPEYDGVRSVTGGGGDWAGGTILTVLGAVDPVGDGPRNRAYLRGGRGLTWAATVDHGDVWLATDNINGRVRELDPAADRLLTQVGYPECDPGTQALGAVDAWVPARYTCRLHAPAGIVYSADPVEPYVFISEVGGQDILRLDLEADPWQLAVYAGARGSSGNIDGQRNQARFASPSGLAVGPDPAAPQSLLVADTGNDRVRVVALDTGAVTTLVGSSSGDNPSSATPVAAALARFYRPEGVAFGGHGDVYVADTGNHRVRRLDSGGEVANVAGTGLRGYPLTAASETARDQALASPRALHLDSHGNLFILGEAQVYEVIADASDVADGACDLRVIYGAEPRTAFPDSATTCLAALAAASDDTLYVLDNCVGLWVQIDRAP
jgi:cysteine-rich repeat protein